MIDPMNCACGHPMTGWELAFFAACLLGPVLGYMAKVAMEKRQ
jgi:hypothetical protein